ncbi:MAG TPA: hypothetical protein VFU63_01675 [Ktedonobacterales bacterium]|nr:hypothetical protein [Ktedonobacterales bacterium]
MAGDAKMLIASRVDAPLVLCVRAFWRFCRLVADARWQWSAVIGSLSPAAHQ